jgi:hypothetical protein
VEFEPSLRELAFCYGQGRLNLPAEPLSPIPVAELGDDLRALAELPPRLQFSCARPLTVRTAADQTSPL